MKNKHINQYMNRHFILFTTFVMLFNISQTMAYSSSNLSLAGKWDFALDPKDIGVKECWYSRILEKSIQLPGSLQAQGLGLPVTVDTPWTANVMDRSFWTEPEHEQNRNDKYIRMPCWLTPTNYYVGVAWYQKSISIPEAWRGRRIMVRFERVHWTSRLWLDDTEATSFGGTQESLGAPHIYDLGTSLTPGQHKITLRIDNKMLVDVGNWAHSVSDHTQGNWNGVIGEMTLTATSPVALDDVQIYTNGSSGHAILKVSLRHKSDAKGKGILRVAEHSLQITWPSEVPYEFAVPLPNNAKLWDEFNPNLYRMTLDLSGNNANDRRELCYGIRDIGTTSSREFTINNRPIILRGTLECAIFPKTGYPPTDEASWERIFKICRDHGLNHVRFHSWTPPKAAFITADRMGFYLQIEMGAWTGVGKNQPQDAWLYREAARVLKEYGNHPSFVLMAYGNEPLPYSADADRDRWLSKWVDYWKSKDSRRLQTSAGFYPQLPENQFHITLADRGPSRWPDKLLRTDPRVPIIVHEMGQYCVYPDFNEMQLYTGHLKPRNYEIFRDTAEKNGVLPLAQEFLFASGRLQVLCYKEDIESALRTPGVAGYQLLDLHDFPGQGSAIIGVLNSLWGNKGYITPAEYRRFSGITVPLIRAPRVVVAEGSLVIPIDLAHYGATPTPKSSLEWTLKNSVGTTVYGGSLKETSYPVGRSLEIGSIAINLATLPAPAAYKLEITIGSFAANDWPLHVLPKPATIPAPKNVTIATSLTSDLATRVAAGETMVIAHPWLGNGQPVGSFAPVFWNRQWFGSQSTRTLGLLIEPKHPALALFPSEQYTTWAWKDILDRSRSLNLSLGDLSPVVRWIDDWNTNLPLALIAEARVGKGRVLLCAADLAKNIAERPAAAQLLRSLVAYVASNDFAPKVMMSVERLAALTSMPANLRLGAVAEASSANKKHPASLVVDGNPSTFWHTPWDSASPKYPHELTLSLPTPSRLKGVVLTPRQDLANGRPRKVTIFTTTDTSTWRSVATAIIPDGQEPFEITWQAETVSGVRVVCETPQRQQDNFVTMAEVNLIED